MEPGGLTESPSKPGEEPQLLRFDRELLRFLEKNGFAQFEMEALPYEGSSRKYFRLHQTPPADPKKRSTAILCIDQSFESESHDFLILTKFLREAKLNVPALLAADERGWLLLEDGGQLSLDQLYRRDTAHGLAGYRASLDQLARWHKTIAPPPVSGRFFDFEKLWWEMEFLFTHLGSAGRLCETDLLPSADVQMLLREVCLLLARGGPRVFTHRDFHARNILLPDPQSSEVLFIDYQDARMGLPWYDVASLLYDPYVELTPSNRRELLEHFLEISGASRSSEFYYPQALQRIFKALGSYIFLAFEKKKSNYLESIEPALRRLEEIIILGHFPDAFHLYIEQFRGRFLPVLLEAARSRSL